GRALRRRPPPAVPRREKEGEGRQARRLARLVQHALPGAAGPGERPALRLVRRRLWIEEHRGHGRRRSRPLGLSRDDRHRAAQWGGWGGGLFAAGPRAMTAAALAVIGSTVVLSSFISGVFGMAGGMILLGVLLVYFDVATA